MNTVVEQNLDALEEVGFLLVKNALSPEVVKQVRQRINHARVMGWEEGLNEVGNMWFDTLLDREPETFAQLVAHQSVSPYLEGMMGKQCQLRSFRAHINPGPYVQEWHMDFYGYWEARRDAEKHRTGVPATSINTTYYFQDNDPGEGHLKFVKNGHRSEPPGLRHPFNREVFDEWCESQEHVILHPGAGDVVIFLSHIPHQGAKERDDMERCNVVCHYQVTPMYEGIWYVSSPRPFEGSFPFVDKEDDSS